MKLLLIASLLFSINSFAQSDCACCTENHQAFDFWLGDWNVYDTLGNKVGENTIVKLEDNCILNEHWRGVKGSTGRSYNYFDSKDSTWNQVWIDNTGGNLVLKGHRRNNVMILQSEFLKGKTIPLYRNRITWTKNENGTVTQLWEIIDDHGHLLNELFRGIYKKKEP